MSLKEVTKHYKAAKAAHKEAKDKVSAAKKAVKSASTQLAGAQARATLREAEEVEAAVKAAKGIAKRVERVFCDALTPPPAPLAALVLESQSVEDEARAEREVEEAIASQPAEAPLEEEEQEEDEGDAMDLEPNEPVPPKPTFVKEVTGRDGKKRKIVDVRAAAKATIAEARASAPQRHREVPEREASKSVVGRVPDGFKKVYMARIRQESAPGGKRRTVLNGVERNTVKQPQDLVNERQVHEAQQDTKLCILDKGSFEEAVFLKVCKVLGLKPKTAKKSEAYLIFRKTALGALGFSAESFLVEVNEWAQAIAEEMAIHERQKQQLADAIAADGDALVVSRAKAKARKEAEEQGLDAKAKKDLVKKAIVECERRRSEAFYADFEWGPADSAKVEVNELHVRIAAMFLENEMERRKVEYCDALMAALTTEAKKAWKKAATQRQPKLGFRKTKRSKKSASTGDDEDEEVEEPEAEAEADAESEEEADPEWRPEDDEEEEDRPLKRSRRSSD
jgi:hypothetical protein